MAKNLFNSIQVDVPQRNFFDLSHDYKTTADMGWLFPCMKPLMCFPGDGFHIGNNSLIRLMPMLAPVMHRMDIYFHYFFVPNRLVWPEWEAFITGSPENYAHPYLTLDQSLADEQLSQYFGLPLVPLGSSFNVSAIPYAGYQKIWNDIYRSQQLQTEVVTDLVSGNNDSNADLKVMRRRAWEHDYFTSALPNAQLGEPVNLPLSGLTDMPIAQNITLGADGELTGVAPQDDVFIHNKPSTNTDISNGYLYADASDVDLGAISVNDLRYAQRLQRWLEKSARGGTRYTESNKVHFGVSSSDARMQRPEFIVGVKSPITISEVLNTSGQNTLDPDDPGLPQGNMAGHGIAVTQGRYGHYFCEEHGYIHCIASILPRTAYSQGVHRDWTTFDHLDYYWPEFANLGEQAILNRELYPVSTGTGQNAPDAVFGYIPRYAQHKFVNSVVTGAFRSSLKFWQMGREFGDFVALNADFIECNPSKLIFAVQDTNFESVVLQVYHDIKAKRPMPKYGTPTW